MSEPFSTDDFAEAGNAVLNIFEALENEDLQRHLIEARTAIEAAVDHLRGQGFSSKDAALCLVGIVLSPCFDDGRGGQ
jgi:hypothetical protein